MAVEIALEGDGARNGLLDLKFLGQVKDDLSMQKMVQKDPNWALHREKFP